MLALRSGLIHPRHPVNRLKLVMPNTAGVPLPVNLDPTAVLHALVVLARTLIRMLAPPAHTSVSLPHRLMILVPPPTKHMRFPSELVSSLL